LGLAVAASPKRLHLGAPTQQRGLPSLCHLQVWTSRLRPRRGSSSCSWQSEWGGQQLPLCLLLTALCWIVWDWQRRLMHVRGGANSLVPLVQWCRYDLRVAREDTQDMQRRLNQAQAAAHLPPCSPATAPAAAAAAAAATGRAGESAGAEGAAAGAPNGGGEEGSSGAGGAALLGDAGAKQQPQQQLQGADATATFDWACVGKPSPSDFKVCARLCAIVCL